MKVRLAIVFALVTLGVCVTAGTAAAIQTPNFRDIGASIRNIGGDSESIDDVVPWWLIDGEGGVGEICNGLICVNNPFGGEDAGNDGDEIQGDNTIIIGPTIWIPIADYSFLSDEQPASFDGYYEQPEETTCE